MRKQELKVINESLRDQIREMQLRILQLEHELSGSKEYTLDIERALFRKELQNTSAAVYSLDV